MAARANRAETVFVETDNEGGDAWFAAAERLAAEFRRTGAERDRAGAVPHQEIDALRQAGLLTAALPKTYGGGGASWVDALRLVRIISRGDSSIGQLLGYHYVNAFTPIWGGSSEQANRLVTATVKEGWYWGAAVNPRDPALMAPNSG